MSSTARFRSTRRLWTRPLRILAGKSGGRPPHRVVQHQRPQIHQRGGWGAGSREDPFVSVSRIDDKIREDLEYLHEPYSSSTTYATENHGVGARRERDEDG